MARETGRVQSEQNGYPLGETLVTFVRIGGGNRDPNLALKEAKFVEGKRWRCSFASGCDRIQ